VLELATLFFYIVLMKLPNPFKRTVYLIRNFQSDRNFFSQNLEMHLLLLVLLGNADGQKTGRSNFLYFCWHSIAVEMLNDVDIAVD
jgi:hypothetical protein